MRATLLSVHASQVAEEGGVGIRRALPLPGLPELDPFVFLDHMGPVDLPPNGPRGSPPHPHAGIETVSYVLSGRVEHRDSAGGHGIVTNGGMQWMTAGRGVIHSEMAPEPDWETGQHLHAIQLWVNLPEADKASPPKYSQRNAQDIPEGMFGPVNVRVLAGRVGDIVSDQPTFTRLTIAHVAFEEAASVELPLDDDMMHALYVLDGSIEVDDRTLESGAIGRLSPGDSVSVKSMGATDLLLLSGIPIGEPVLAHGPFVMTSRAGLERAYDDAKSGRFGQLW